MSPRGPEGAALALAPAGILDAAEPRVRRFVVLAGANGVGPSILQVYASTHARGMANTLSRYGVAPSDDMLVREDPVSVELGAVVPERARGIASAEVNH